MINITLENAKAILDDYAKKYPNSAYQTSIVEYPNVDEVTLKILDYTLYENVTE